MNASLPQDIKSRLTTYITSQRSNSWAQLMNNGFLYLIVMIISLLAVGIILSVFILNSVFPFHVLSKIEHSDAVLDALGSRSDAHTFTLAVKGLIIGLGFLLLFLARSIYQQIQLRKEMSKAHKLLQEIEKATLVTQPQMSSKDQFHLVEPKNLDLPK